MMGPDDSPLSYRCCFMASCLLHCNRTVQQGSLLPVLHGIKGPGGLCGGLDHDEPAAAPWRRLLALLVSVITAAVEAPTGDLTAALPLSKCRERASTHIS